MQNESTAKIRQVIKSQLPELVKNDPEVREFILQLTRDVYADKVESESRFDRLLNELKRDREANEKKWEEEIKVREQRWLEWERKWEEERKADQQRWEANEKKWEEQHQKWLKWEKKWEEEAKAREQRWLANEKKWEEEIKAREQRWLANDKKWEEQHRKWLEWEKKWEENQEVIKGMMREIQKLHQKHDSSIGALGARWGLHSESAFRNGLQSILEDSFPVQVERYQDYDYEGKVFGRPDQVELDVIIFNGTLILCEIKSSMSKSDLYAFWRKKNFYEEKHGKAADRALVISPMIDPKAEKVASELNIELFGYAEDVKL